MSDSQPEQTASVTLQSQGASYTHTLPLSLSLFDVLVRVERERGLKWTEWHGVPAPEVHAGFEVHINLPGYMQPILIQTGTTPPRRFDTNAQLRKSTLGDLVKQADGAASVVLELSHKYTPPPKTAAEQKAIVDNFQRRYAELTGGEVPQAQAQVVEQEEEEEKESEVVEEEDEEEEDLPPLVLPADRGLKLLHALPGMLRVPELPEEFYEVTPEDSRVHARSIRTAAGSARGGGVSAKSKRSRARATLLRVRLPNHLYIEGLFKLDETPAEVYRFLDELLAPSLADTRSYYIYLTPPRQVLSRTSRLTLAQLGLFPQALLHLGSEARREQAHAGGAFVVAPDTPEEVAAKEQPALGLLREHLFSRIIKVAPPPPTPSPAATTSETDATDAASATTSTTATPDATAAVEAS